jgi:hypothetical protein
LQGLNLLLTVERADRFGRIGKRRIILIHLDPRDDGDGLLGKLPLFKFWSS